MNRKKTHEKFVISPTPIQNPFFLLLNTLPHTPTPCVGVLFLSKKKESAEERLAARKQDATSIKSRIIT